MPNENTQGQEKAAKNNSQANAKGKQRVVSHPGEIASIVMMQIDAVNTKKDELTIAAKGLADTAKQLVRAYAQQAAVIQKLSKRVKELEEKGSK